MSMENVKIVRRVAELINAREFVPALELVDPEVEFDLSRNVFNPDVYRGYAGLEKWQRTVDDMWDEFRGVIEELIDAEDKVVARMGIRGKGRESGVEVAMQVYTIWTFRGGKVVRVVGGYRDRSEALEDAGLHERDAPGL